MHRAIAVLFLVVTPLSLISAIGQLASATVLMLLSVFAVVYFSLLVLKRRAFEPRGRFEVHSAVPLLGTVVCLVLVVVRVANGDWRASALAGAMLIRILLVDVASRSKSSKVAP